MKNKDRGFVTDFNINLLQIKNNSIVIYLIISEMKFNKRENVEKLYNEMLAKFDKDTIILNGILHAYGILRLEKPAEKLFFEAVRNKDIISIPVFTSIIKCYSRSYNVEKAWELYNDRYLYIQEEDDMLISVMINICANQKKAEKAKNLWNKLMIKGKFNNKFVFLDDDLKLYLISKIDPPLLKIIFL